MGVSGLGCRVLGVGCNICIQGSGRNVSSCLAKIPEASQTPILLGGSWVVLSGVISPLTWVVSIVAPLITPIITTHEPYTTLNPKPLNP